MAEPLRAALDAVARTVPLTATQGATIVSEISGKLERWMALKQPPHVVVPGIEDVSLLRGGSVWWCRGHVVPESRVVPALGALLASMLGTRAEHRAPPAGLLYVVARATDPHHLVPLSGLAEFRSTLARYVAPVPRITIDALVARYAVACSGLPALSSESTISDVRRLRRAGGVPLTQIAADTAIPVSLLRELEWGIYTHWNLPETRGALDLYAERAGLDGDLIARIVQQEQALEVLPVSAPEPIGARTTSSERVAVPFALAALVAAAIRIGAPGDRPPVLQPAPPLAPQRPLPTASAAPTPATKRPEIVRARQQIKPAAKHPSRSVRSASVPVGTSRETRPAPHSFLKLARAIAGDGRYAVEPFPRVRQEK